MDDSNHIVCIEVGWNANKKTAIQIQVTLGASGGP